MPALGGEFVVQIAFPVLLDWLHDFIDFEKSNHVPDVVTAHLERGIVEHCLPSNSSWLHWFGYCLDDDRPM